MVVWDDLLPEYPADALIASYGGHRPAVGEPPRNLSRPPQLVRVCWKTFD